MEPLEPTDRERWDAKYRGEWGTRPEEVDPFVARMLDRLDAERSELGRALDLASGRGRHALELARRGWRTTAWDVSPVALALLEKSARACGLEIECDARDVLGRGGAGARAFAPEFDLVVNVNFYDAGLWSRLIELVPVGGLVLVRTYTYDWPAARPPREFRLVPGALASGLHGFETLECEESGGRAGLLGRRR